jgi:hypothetical protein
VRSLLFSPLSSLLSLNVCCRFELLDLSKETDSFTELFEIPVHEDMLISDVKQVTCLSIQHTLLPPILLLTCFPVQMILPLLQQKGLSVTAPTHIRLRDVSSSQYSRRVGKVFQDSLTVKKATLYVYSKRVAVQILNEPEPLTNQDKEICFFIQVFLFVFLSF